MGDSTVIAVSVTNVIYPCKQARGVLLLEKRTFEGGVDMYTYIYISLSISLCIYV